MTDARDSSTDGHHSLSTFYVELPRPMSSRQSQLGHGLVSSTTTNTEQSAISSDTEQASRGHFGWVDTIVRRWKSLREGMSYSDNEQADCRHHHNHRHDHHRHHQGDHHVRECHVWRRGGGPSGRLHHSTHSLASVELASWTARAANRRGSTLTLPFSTSLTPIEAARKADSLEGQRRTQGPKHPGILYRFAHVSQLTASDFTHSSEWCLQPRHDTSVYSVQAAIIKLFQRKALKENELGTLQESVRTLSEAEAGSLIYEYYKDQLLKKGMVILREKIKNERGAELMAMLGETWDYFFKEILPTLQALMYPLAVAIKGVDIRNTTLLEFRNIVVLKVGLKDAVDSKRHPTPENIRQMLLVLQSLNDPTFLSKEQLDLERLTACVVEPFLGSRGLYQGGPEPVTKATYRPAMPSLPLSKPQITITGVSEDREEQTILPPPSCPMKLDHHPYASPPAMRKLHDPYALSRSPLSSPSRLKPVMEVAPDVPLGRRHSIVGT